MCIAEETCQLETKLFEGKGLYDLRDRTGNRDVDDAEFRRGTLQETSRGDYGKIRKQLAFL